VRCNERGLLARRPRLENEDRNGVVEGGLDCEFGQAEVPRIIGFFRITKGDFSLA
jgi:hypothetical protein